MQPLDRARRIVEGLGSRVLSLREIVGEGEVNYVFVVETQDGKWVVRFHLDPLDTDDYATEEWCLTKAREAGIAVPDFIARGERDASCYIVQSFAEGVNGQSRQTDLMWTTLGRYARLINEIPLDTTAPDSLFPRFGRDLVKNWHEHIDYNLGELHPEDKLLALGAYRQEWQTRIKAIFENLRDKVDRFGLTHGDLVPKNTLVNGLGNLTVIDWGSAGTGAIPFNDYNRVRYCNPEEAYTAASLERFAEGYGIPVGDLEETLHHLYLLGAIDVVRWAIDKRPDRVPHYVERARQTVEIAIKLG